MQTVTVNSQASTFENQNAVRKTNGAGDKKDSIGALRRLLNDKPINTNIASFLLRVLVGGLFVRYGYMKFSSYDTILPMFQDIIGIGAKLSFNLVIFAELICGFFVLVGFLTRLSVIPILISMVVAFFIAHQNDPFDMKAISFVFLCLSVVIFVLGSGKYSVDRLIFKKGSARKNV
jgi:putative oxidoreductase